MSTSQKVIAVIGATGAEGRSVISALTEPRGQSKFSPRAITRDQNSEMAQALKNLGIDVVQADVHDTGSLIEAMTGIYGLYATSFFWDSMSPKAELDQIRKTAAAASQAKVQHVIWSTHDDTRKLSTSTMPTIMGHYRVPHFDAKAEGDAIFADNGLPTTYLVAPFHWDDLIYFDLGPKKRPNDGNWVLSLPLSDRRLPGIASEDIGKCAVHIFERPDFINKHVHLCSEALTGHEMATAMTRVFEREIVYHCASFEEFRKKDFPGADAIGNMFQYFHDSETEQTEVGKRIEETRKMNPELLTFEQWLTKHKSQFGITLI